MSVAAQKQIEPIRSHNAGPSAVWSSGGLAYDEISRGILDAIEHGINRLAPVKGEAILDVATGTGRTARRLAERGFDVTAIDFAPDVVEAAREIARRRNLDIAFHHGDAEDLPYPDSSFDAVISTFGVMFVQRPEDAARELARVCRPGGRLALTVWTPDSNVAAMFKIMREFMPPPVGSPPPSPFAWGEPERVRELLGRSFDLAFERGTSFYREPSGTAAWNTFVRGYGPLHSLAGKLDTAARQELQRAFIAFSDSFADELGITVPRDYWVIVGKRR